MNTYSAYSDKDLMTMLLQDNVTAFTELYNRYWKKLYTTTYSVLHNTETARDIVQDIFTSLWERRYDLTIDYPSAYLYQAARFQVFKTIRSNRMDEGFYQRLAGVSAVIVHENPVLFKELTEILDKVLEGLPEDHRKAFLLSREDGLTYKEIAGTMNISPKTVEKKMSQALKRLRLGFDEAFMLVSVLLTLCA